MNSLTPSAASPRQRAASLAWREQASHLPPLESARGFPGLGEIIRLVDEAVGARDAARIVAKIQSELPDAIRRHRERLGGNLLRADARGYRRIELHHCPIRGYQVLAMVWGPGQGTPVHDHREVWGIESVWTGELEVAEFRPSSVAGEMLQLAPKDVVRLRTGDVLSLLPDQGLHLCRNPGVREVTVSLHIYARPLDHFNVYLDAGEGWHARHDHRPALERSALPE